MHIYRLQRRLSHADVDFLGELKMAALLGLLEQAAVEASTALGFDAEWYMREGRIWIIHRTRVERHVPVGGGDTVEVETQIADFRRVRSLRRYCVRRGTTIVAQASTDWVYCDLATGRPTRIPESMQHVFSNGEGPALLPRPPALAASPAEPAQEMALTVAPSHLDHVIHVNNAVYLNFLEDAALAVFATHGWPLSRMLAAGGALRLRCVDIEYLRDAQVDERLRVRSWLQDGNVAGEALSTAGLLHSIADADGLDVVRARTDWVWRRKPTVIGGVPPA